ncbi:LysR family transcriptional regulator [Sphingosinicella terrae]|uniref:LysR family transcriptional regulator n=1 Tax=Sphingosinicella terrae TaxID=2172047 RepID=UPI000E0CD12B|nr:LysR family transcriptional regulator [Sphingosinicella terrae]
MRLDSFDLNLLVAFDVLLEERSVTRAARRLNVTQSAMSASLKRLREAMQDEILVQHGKRMIPTAHALKLAPEISAAILALRSLISAGTAFDPATSQRRFRIEASDYITTVLIVPLLTVLAREAPGIALDLSLPFEGSAERLANGDLDLLLTPEQFMRQEHPRELLFEERHVVVGWSGNPLLHRRMTESEFFDAGHVAVRISDRDTFIESVLRDYGPRRRIEVIAPSFIQAPWLLPGTLRLALMHERLARLVAPGLSLAIGEPPIPLPVMREMMQFHAARAKDPGLEWLRARLRDLAVRA